MADVVPVKSSVGAEVDEDVTLIIGDREALTEIDEDRVAMGDRETEADADIVRVPATPLNDPTGDRDVVTVIETEPELDCV